MKKKLNIKRVEYYGRESFVPECELSKAFAALLEQKTLTRANLKKIKDLGYEIELMEVFL